MIDFHFLDFLNVSMLWEVVKLHGHESVSKLAYNQKRVDFWGT